MKRNDKKRIAILEGSLNKNIFLFALPLAVTGILQQLFNAADVAIVGQYVGKEAMAAVGSNSPIVGLIVNAFVGISIGTNVIIANFAGMKSVNGIKKAIDTSLLLAVICGIGAAILGETLVNPVLTLIGVPQDVYPMAEAYLRIYLLGLPVILVYNFEAAIFRSQGDSVTPLIYLTISGVINVALNLFFVLVMGMDANGVALATVIANAVSALSLFMKLHGSKTVVGLERHRPTIDKEILKKVLAVGLPAGLQSAVFSISNICIQSAINGLGADIMAGSAAAFNIEIVAYYIINSFGQACTTFTGQNDGAGNAKRCKEVLKKCLGQNIIMTVTISAIILLASKPLLRLFTTDAVVMGFAATRLKFILYVEFINSMIETFSGAMRGYGHSLVPALTALFGICGTRIIWVFTIFPMDPSFTRLLWCYPISWTLTVTVLIAAYLIFMRKKRR